jgi:hypothetical protein
MPVMGGVGGLVRQIALEAVYVCCQLWVAVRKGDSVAVPLTLNVRLLLLPVGGA